MRIDKELKNQGFEIDPEQTKQEVPAEIWVNKRTKLGIRLDWFRLRR